METCLGWNDENGPGKIRIQYSVTNGVAFRDDTSFNIIMEFF